MLAHQTAMYYSTSLGGHPIATMQMCPGEATWGRGTECSGSITPAYVRNKKSCVAETPPAPHVPEPSAPISPLSVCSEYVMCTNGGPHPFIVYTLVIPVENQQVILKKRFSTIKKLHADLIQENLVRHLPSLPRDRPWALGGNRKDFIEGRMADINCYFRGLLANTSIGKSNSFKTFLMENDTFTIIDNHPLK